MPDVAIPEETLRQFALNGSTTQVVYYTESEILKIEIAGAILVIAVLVLTYAVYAWYIARYRRWVSQKELEDRVAAGDTPDPSEYPPLPKGANKVLMYIIGGLVVLAGIVLYVIP